MVENWDVKKVLFFALHISEIFTISLLSHMTFVIKK